MKSKEISKYTMPLSEFISHALFFIMMFFTVAFPNSGSIKGYIIIVYSAYTFLLELTTLKTSQKSPMHFLWSLGFLAFGLCSSLWALYPASVREVSNNIVWSMLISILVVRYIIQNCKDIDTLAKILVPIALFFVINMILNGGFSDDGRLSVDINENTFGKIASGLFCLVLYLCNKNNWKKLHQDIILVGLVVASLLSGSRKSLLAMMIYFVGIIAFSSYAKEKGSTFVKLVIMGVFLFVAYICLMEVDALYSSIGHRLESLLDFAFEDAEGDSSIISRMNMIEIALELFGKNPLLGSGLNAFKYATYYGTYSHNNYVELLSGGGIVGVLLYYVPIVCFLIVAIKNWSAQKSGAIVPMLMIMVFLINDYGGVSYFSITDHAFLAMAIGLTYLNSKEDPTTEKDLQKSNARKRNKNRIRFVFR